MKSPAISLVIYSLLSLNNHSVAATQSELTLALEEQQKKLTLIKREVVGERCSHFNTHNTVGDNVNLQG